MLATEKIEAAEAELLSEELEADADLVEVTTKGDVGTSKVFYVSGVASSVPCGIVMHVTPEVAEQMRQCSII